MADRLLPYLRLGFLGAVVVFAYLGLRGRWSSIGSALSAVSVWSVLLALLLVLVGLFVTGLLWLRLMASLGGPLPLRDGLATFFVGQLGKYIPGSVWSLGAQASLARRYDVPARATVAAGLVFLGYHLVTGVLLGAAVLLLGLLDSPWPAWVSWLLLLGSLAGLLPPVVRVLAGRIGGRDADITWSSTFACLGLMALTWSAYAGALVLLSPTTHDPVVLGAAFALSYALGVVIVLAPAGVGARETLFVVLLAPYTTVAEATALALVARVLHTGADALMALGWWAVAKRSGAPTPQKSSTSLHEAWDSRP